MTRAVWKCLPPGVVQVNPAEFGPSFETRSAARAKADELNALYPLADYRAVKVQTRRPS